MRTTLLILGIFLGSNIATIAEEVGQKNEAPARIGRAVLVKGTVFKEGPTGKVLLKNGDHLLEGDVVNSSNRSFVKVLMKDDTIFSLGPKTKFVFEKFHFQTKSKRTATYNVVRGKVRSLFTVKSPDKSLKIKTPTVTMGIRGTEILTDVYKMKGIVKTDVALVEGKLEVNAVLKGKITKTVDLKPGFIFKTSKDKPTKGPGSKALVKIPKIAFDQLKKGDKKGGRVFLSDALIDNGAVDLKKADYSFDPAVDDTTELKTDDQIKKEGKRKEKKIVKVQEVAPKKSDNNGIDDMAVLKKFTADSEVNLKADTAPVSADAAKTKQALKVQVSNEFKAKGVVVEPSDLENFSTDRLNKMAKAIESGDEGINASIQVIEQRDFSDKKAETKSIGSANVKPQSKPTAVVASLKPAPAIKPTNILIEGGGNPLPKVGPEKPVALKVIGTEGGGKPTRAPASVTVYNPAPVTKLERVETVKPGVGRTVEYNPSPIGRIKLDDGRGSPSVVVAAKPKIETEIKVQAVLRPDAGPKLGGNPYKPGIKVDTAAIADKITDRFTTAMDEKDMVVTTDMLEVVKAGASEAAKAKLSGDSDAATAILDSTKAAVKDMSKDLGNDAVSVDKIVKASADNVVKVVAVAPKIEVKVEPKIEIKPPTPVVVEPPKDKPNANLVKKVVDKIKENTVNSGREGHGGVISNLIKKSRDDGGTKKVCGPLGFICRTVSINDEPKKKKKRFRLFR